MGQTTSRTCVVQPKSIQSTSPCSTKTLLAHTPLPLRNNNTVQHVSLLNMSYSLPTHLFVHVLEYLPLHYFPTVFGVCQNWYDALDTNASWKYYALNMFGEEINILSSVSDGSNNLAVNPNLGSWKDLVIRHYFDGQFEPISWQSQQDSTRVKVYQVCVIGLKGAGKTCMLDRLKLNTFNPQTDPTIGVELYMETAQYNNRLLTLQIFDVSGDVRFQSISRSVYRSTELFLIAVDLSRSETLDWAIRQFEQLQEEHSSACFMIVGTKSDIKDISVVQRAMEFCTERNLPFMHCSSKRSALSVRGVNRQLFKLVNEYVPEVRHYAHHAPVCH